MQSTGDAQGYPQGQRPLLPRQDAHVSRSSSESVRTHTPQPSEALCAQTSPPHTTPRSPIRPHAPPRFLWPLVPMAPMTPSRASSTLLATAPFSPRHPPRHGTLHTSHTRSATALGTGAVGPPPPQEVARPGGDGHDTLTHLLERRTVYNGACGLVIISIMIDHHQHHDHHCHLCGDAASLHSAALGRTVAAGGAGYASALAAGLQGAMVGASCW